MPTLLIRMFDGSIYKGRQPMHFMVAEEFNLDFDLIEDVGVVTKHGRFIWLGRKPH